MRNHWTEIEKYLEDQKIAQELIGELRDFHMRYEVKDQVKERVEKPDILFYGKKILEMSIAALLQGDNLLLSGAKATGKNVLCETLAWIFGRPEYDISFHVNTDSADLIGTDTFINNEVRLRKGPIYQCAEFGGFGILDEINMAKNDAVSVLHATLDHRRRIDIPGYNRILLHPATRFIGTMNYGYAGTRELNEALVSRFMVIDEIGDVPRFAFVIRLTPREFTNNPTRNIKYRFSFSIFYFLLISYLQDFDRSGKKYP